MTLLFDHPFWTGIWLQLQNVTGHGIFVWLHCSKKSLKNHIDHSFRKWCSTSLCVLPMENKHMKFSNYYPAKWYLKIEYTFVNLFNSLLSLCNQWICDGLNWTYLLMKLLKLNPYYLDVVLRNRSFSCWYLWKYVHSLYQSILG